MNNIRKQYLEFCPLQGNLLDVLADPSPHNIRNIIVPQENRKDPATILHYFGRGERRDNNDDHSDFIHLKCMLVVDQDMSCLGMSMWRERGGGTLSLPLATNTSTLRAKEHLPKNKRTLATHPVLVSLSIHWLCISCKWKMLSWNLPHEKITWTLLDFISFFT